MDRTYIAWGCSAGFLVAAFFLAGLHHEVKHQLWMRKRRKERGGFIA